MWGRFVFLGLVVCLSVSARGANLGRTLFIGDSLSMDEFGDTVVAELSRSTSTYSFYAGCGSKPNSWVLRDNAYVTRCGYWARNSRGAEYKVPWSRFRPRPATLPFLQDMLRAEPIDTLIVQLGLNLLDTENLTYAFKASYVKANLQSFVQAMTSDSRRRPRQCFWITPNRATLWSADIQEKLFRAINEEMRGVCRVIDGRTFTKNASIGADGYHVHGRDARRFATDVFAYIRQL